MAVEPGHTPRRLASGVTRVIFDQEDVMFQACARGTRGGLVALVCVGGFVLPMSIAEASPSNALLTIDQNRAAIVDRIVLDRGPALVQSGTGLTSDHLRSMLLQLRADQLLAASLAGTLDGLRDVLARALVGTDPINPALLVPVSSSAAVGTFTKAIGDPTDDVVYTPVTPCRLVETRGTFAAVYQGDGTPAHTADPFNVNEVRTYAIASGNGVCTSQLPIGVAPVAVQLQVFGIPTTAASGDIEILPQGATFGSTATEVFIGSIAFNTVSTTAKVNIANNEISVKVTGGKANLAMDIVGYFKVPSSYDGTTIISGVDASVGGGINNAATGYVSTIPGGYGNTASGSASFAAGVDAIADQIKCVVFSLWDTATGMSCLGTSNIFRIGADHGFSVDYNSQRPDGGGYRWVAIGDLFSDQTISTWNGAFLSDTGVWTNASDRNAKQDFAAVDPGSVLDKVVALPITTWHYKTDTTEQHLGPMAQDFRAAFGLGADDKHIGTLDEEGVALAAIKGLNAKLERDNAELQAESAELRSRNDDLGRRLEALERTIAH
jgi:Chaperone of endosialidase